MAARHQLQALRNHPNLQRFLIANARPTGRQLGVGSYGSVEELDVSGVVCAGKRIHESLIEQGNFGAENIVSKYVEECQLMSDLRHPHLVQFLGVSFLPNSTLPVLVMERLLTSLDDLLEHNPDIPLSLKRSILADVARGLVYLHSRSPPVIHRDLSAKNVLLNSAMVAKITDLGNSRIVSFQPGQLARTLSRIPGTTVYMPPEAFEASSKYGPSLDSFSFGHLSLFTVTQVFPSNLRAPNYSDPGDPDRLLARTEVERRGEYIRLLCQKLGDQHPLVRLIKQCLHNIPSRRPSTQGLLQQLESMRAQIEDPHEHLTKLEAMRMLREKDTALRERDAALREKDTALREKDTALREKDAALTAVVREKDTALREKDAALTAAVREKDTALREKDAALREKDTTLTAAVREKDAALREKDAAPREKDTTLREKDTALREKDTALREKDTEIGDLHTQVQAAQARIQQLQAETQRKETEIHRLMAELQFQLQKAPEKEPHYPELETLVNLPVSVASEPKPVEENVSLQPGAPLKWECCVDLPVGMIDAQAVVLGNKVYVGGDTPTATQDCNIYVCEFTKSTAWRTLKHPTMMPALTTYQERLVLVGGRNPTAAAPTNQLWVMEDEQTWTQPLPPMPTPRWGASAVSTQQYLITAGGVGRYWSNVVEVYNGKQWVTTDPLPKPCYFMKSTLHYGFLYLMGGTGQSSSVFQCSLRPLTRYSPKKQSLWNSIQDVPYQNCSVSIFGGALVAVGGQDKWKEQKSLHVYDPLTQSWVLAGEMPQAVDCTCTVTLPSGEMLVIGGRTEATGYSPLVYKASLKM